MKDPIDFDSPLGISKKEWTKVLGANLALLSQAEKDIATAKGWTLQ